MIQLLLTAAAFLMPPEVPTPATALDTMFANARASWPGPTPAGYLYGGSIGIGTGMNAVSQRIDLTGCFAARVSGATLSTVVYVSPTANVPAVLDLTGSFQCVVENLTIKADEHGGYALKLGRRPDGASAGDHRFINCVFEGPVLNEGSEGNTFVGCQFMGSATLPALTMRNGTPKPLGFTMQAQDFIACRFNSMNGQPAIVLQVEANAVVTDISFIGGQVATGGGGEAAVVLRTGNVADRQMKMVHFRNMRWEVGDRTTAITVKGSNGVAAFTMRDTTTVQRESIVRSEAAGYAWTFEDVHTVPADGSSGVHYAIDATLTQSHVRIPYAWGFKAATRP